MAAVEGAIMKFSLMIEEARPTPPTWAPADLA